MSASNSRKSFQRIIRYPKGDELARHVELLEDNIAKKFRGIDSAVTTVDSPAISDDRIFLNLDFAIGAGATNDGLIYTVPTISQSGGVFVLSRSIVWLTTRLGTTDTGNVNVRVGTSLNGNDIMVDQNVVAATQKGVIGGLSIASRGSSLLVANGYEYAVASDTPFYIRATTAGTITQGSVLVELFGYFFPTSDNG